MIDPVSPKCTVVVQHGNEEKLICTRDSQNSQALSVESGEDMQIDSSYTGSFCCEVCRNSLISTADDD